MGNEVPVERSLSEFDQGSKSVGVIVPGCVQRPGPRKADGARLDRSDRAGPAV